MRFLVRRFKRAFFTKKNSLCYRVKLITGFYPDNINLYQQAFTHKSVATQNIKGQSLDNERLEFLGDAVLDTVLADYLFRKYPYENEGFLTKMRSKVVNRKQLGILAKKIGLDELLEIDKKRNSPRSSIYGNSFEAFIGAIYLDKGFKTTQKYIVDNVIKNYIDIKELRTTEDNFKSKLLEWSQKQGSTVLFNTSENPQKETSFISSVNLDGKDFKKAQGHSKKEAEQNAAYIALKALKIME